MTFHNSETDVDTQRMTLDEICEARGYDAAKAEAARRNVIWFASAGATRKEVRASGVWQELK